MSPSISTAPANTITVRGTGFAMSAPDKATVYIPLEARADNAAAAYENASKVAQQVVPEISSAAPTARISTASIALNADMQWIDNSSVLAGYISNVTVTATDVPLTGVSQVLSAVVRAGGDSARIGGIEYFSSTVGEVLSGAREEAFQDAFRKAEQLAGLAQKTLGGVVRILEDVEPSSPIRFARESKTVASYSADMPVLGGELTHSVDLQVEFELL